MLLIDGNGLPCGNMIASASPHEVTLIEPLLKNRVIRRRPRTLIYDAAADSDPLRFRLLKRGIDLIAPHKCNRVKKPTQMGESLDAIENDGRSNDLSVGCITSADLSQDMNSIIISSKDS